MLTEERYLVIDDSHGAGGFGKISKRRDTVLDRTVAVKQLHGLCDDNARERFHREAKALARMSHPNIPAIYDVQFDETKMEIYFEFIDGKTLRDLITDKPNSFLVLDKVKLWFLQIASALEHAHQKQIIHRDIKPENIIISADGTNATLVDFGIALTSDDVEKLTKQGYAIGTPVYMSPEQAAGKDLDARTDIYSLGVTFYEALAGLLPQVGSYNMLSDGDETIPRAIDELIKECIQQDRNNRVQSANDFYKKLKLAFRTNVPLSSLLTEGRLHEIIAALRQMAPDSFSSLPRGQKKLLIARLKDLVNIDKPELRLATAQMIALLASLARNLDDAEYGVIVENALLWGFDKEYGPKWQGNDDIRDALEDSARGRNSYSIIAARFIAFVKDKNIGDLPSWYNHALRDLVMALLANPNCDSEADELGVIYEQINLANHEAKELNVSSGIVGDAC